MANRFSDLLIDFYFKPLEHIYSFDLVFLTKPSWNLPAQSIIETLDGSYMRATLALNGLSKMNS